MGIFFAGLSALLYGSGDFAGGLATRHNPVPLVLVSSQVFGLAIALVAAPLVGSPGVLVSDGLWGAAAGLSGAIGLAFLYKGLAVGYIALVAPVGVIVAAAVPVLVGSFLGQLPSLRGWVGIGLGLLAIGFLGWDRVESVDSKKVRRSLGYATVAGLTFAGFSILISQTSATSGLWPLVFSRSTSVLVVAMLLKLQRRRIRVAQSSLGLVATAGVLDTLANVAFLLATRLTILPIVAVVSGLAPAPTVLLGRIILKERLSAVRILGLVLALGGVALLGSG